MDRSREPLPLRVEDAPALPEAYGGALDAGLLGLGLRLDDPARAAIDGQARLLLAWTTAINLTAIRDPAGVALAHVTDSLAGVAVLRDLGIDRFVDLGSGGGYPGLPLAAALPAARAVLAEPILKKARFLSTVVEATGLAGTVSVAAVRAEALASDPRHRGRWPAVTARAVAGLAELVELGLPLLVPGGVLVAWKRGDLRAEIGIAERALETLGGGTIAVHPVAVEGLADHRLVVVASRGRVPAGYPRDPATRKRRPWAATHW